MKNLTKQNRFLISPLAGFIVMLLATSVAFSAMSGRLPGPRFWPGWESGFRFAEMVRLVRAPAPVASEPAPVSTSTPAWLLNAMAGSSSSRAGNVAYLSLDRSGDRTGSESTSADSSAIPFDRVVSLDPQLFNQLSPSAGFAGTWSQQTLGPAAVAVNATYSWNGIPGALWNVNGNWNPNTAFPNGQGDAAINTQPANALTIQSTPGGVTVGEIRHQAIFDTSWTISTSTPITLLQDGAGFGIGVIRNADTSGGANNALIITGTGGLVLADNIDVVHDGNSTNTIGSVQLNTPISGTGNVNFVNFRNNINGGAIALLAANSFTGTTTISVGAVSFNNNSSFGIAANVINLGRPGGGSASLVSSAAVSAMPNNINVEMSPGGILILGGNTAEQTNYMGTVALNSSVVLTSASTVSGGTARTTAFTNTISGMGSVTVTGTSASVGFVEFRGANTYLGGTTVDSGTLLVNNTSSVTSGTGLGPINVHNGGTLGGTGFINSGLVSLNFGATITGGGNGTVASNGAVGTLTLTTTALNLGGIFLVDISGATADRLTLSGDLNLNAEGDTISFNSLAAPTAASYTLISYTGTLSGTFDNVSGLPSGYMLEYNPGEIDLVAVVPEPGTWIGAALALAAIGFSQRRRLRGLIAPRA
jgi:autotransporter-associated beta strand protein